MQKKIIILSLLLLILTLVFSGMCLAKYKLEDKLSISVYIDKTPPIITLKTNDSSNTYKTTDLDNVIKYSTDVAVITSDNIKIQENKYVYNPNENDFTDCVEQSFTSEDIFEDNGYYKITAVDTSGNTTEIILLIDKTEPEVTVQYYKKGEETGNAKITLSSAKNKTFGTSTIVQTDEENTTIENEESIEIIEETSMQTVQTLSNSIMTASTIYVSNESELRSAITNKYSDIVITTSINVSSALSINYAVTISPTSSDNAIRYSGSGSFWTIQSGGTLTLDSIVIDTRALDAGKGVTGINIQSGGKLILKSNSIIDGGSSNTGIVVNSGATAQIYSCHVAYAAKGIVVKGTGSLVFSSESSRTSEFWSNTTAISFESFTGTCNINQSNIKIRNNTNGIIVESSTGTINMSNGSIYSNTNDGIFSKSGTLNISGGSIYSNGNGINFGAGTLNISGSSIYSNKNGIYLNSSYSGKMTITNVNIYSNTQYAIYHGQNTDESCTIEGGTISGNIYLAQNDNYVNTNSSYSSFTVLPSTYYFKRKLVKTTSNEVANTEINKVTMVANGSWYKYVDEEYIVIWKGCNVIVNYTDYYGNILSTEILNGNVGEDYTTEIKEIDGYDLITEPSNSSGTYTTADITVTYKYDLVNVAKVTYEDILSGVVSAKYWYNSENETFVGDGTAFDNGTIFEDYGYYKILVVNGVGLEKELTFILDKDSYVR